MSLNKLECARPGVDKLQCFSRECPDLPVADIKKQLGVELVIKLSFNESPYGSSPRVQEALQEAIGALQLYPASYADGLCSAIAEDFRLSTNQVLIGNGADEVINLVVQAFVAPEQEVIVPFPTFGAYGAATHMVGGEVVKIPLAGWILDLEAMKAAITDKTKMIFICNPNNPTSTLLPLIN
ncbi:hypothetical protein N752_21550 [Desulforamulus aquiferis]|nr:hypothetical protein N752_21550 [Desulforamulus aquiferis]